MNKEINTIEILTAILEKDDVKFIKITSKKENHISLISNITDEKFGHLRVQLTYFIKDGKRAQRPYSINLFLTRQRIEATFISNEIIMNSKRGQGIITTREVPIPTIVKKYDSLIRMAK